MIQDREKAAFEAGIKLGALYHQWIGTPFSNDLAPTIEKVIEGSVSLQPFVKDIKVSLVRERVRENPYGYSELTGDVLDVHVVTEVNGATCHAALSFEHGYPLMKLVAIENQG